MIRPRKTFASSTLLWFRDDMSRQDVRTYWRGPHAQYVARCPGFLEYRQHHFVADPEALWPEVSGLDTARPARTIDGLAEVVLDGLIAVARQARYSQKVKQDEVNLFGKTILYNTLPGQGRWYDMRDRGPVRHRVVIFLRARQLDRAFRRFVRDELPQVLVEDRRLHELHIQPFMKWDPNGWDTPGVAHDNPVEEHYHGSAILGFGSEEECAAYFAGGTVAGLSKRLLEYCTAVHTFTVEKSHILVDNGRIMLPQNSPQPRPRFEAVKRVLPPPPGPAAAGTISDVPNARLLGSEISAPEDVVADNSGYLFCGASDGAILRVDPKDESTAKVGETGGRPLGLEALPNGKLLVCDAHRGLLQLDPQNGALETLVTDVEDIPLRFCSNVTAAKDGTVWFTESTNRYDFEHYVGALLEHRGSGRLLRRDPDGEITVLLDGLHFANGLTLTEDETAVIFAETGAYRLKKLTVCGPNSGQLEVIADNLSGFPDNVSRMKAGRFWVAITNPRNPGLDLLGRVPGWIRKLAWPKDPSARKAQAGITRAMCFDADGTLLADVQTRQKDFVAATGVVELEGRLYFAGVSNDGLLEVPLQNADIAAPRPLR